MMNRLRIQNLNVSYGATAILTDAELELQNSERAALIGVNGAGKSTLLRTIAGLLPPDQGSITTAKDTRIGYLAQMPPLDEERTVWQEARAVFAHVDALENRMQTAALALTQANALQTDTLADKYAYAEQEFLASGGYEVDSRVRKVLSGMKFAPSAWEQLVATLSGGQKTRLQFAKLLLQEPDLLLLDEPTNHLDLDTVEWLEDYLLRYSGAILVVSHDRFFLDRIASITFDLAQGRVTRYSGNYSAYLDAKEAAEVQAQDAYERQQQEIARLQTFIDQNIARATTTSRAQSRRKALAKLERLTPPAKRRHAHFDFPFCEKSGKLVLELEQAAIIRGNGALFPPVSLQVWRGDKIALTGANGVGKSSLLRAILAAQADAGEIRVGNKVQMAMFEQEFAFADPERTVMEELWAAYPQKTETDIRTRLGHLLFSGEDVFKPVKNLSGGERNRLQLAILSWSEANLLLFDEPTNHLDIPAKEVLERALREYEGTLVFVSHDRFFIDRLATRFVRLEPDRFLILDGNYRTYLEWKSAERQSAAPNRPNTVSTEAMQAHERRRQERSEARKLQTRIDRLEREIQHLEQDKTQLEASLADPSLYENRENAAVVERHFHTVTKTLEELYEEWLAVTEDTRSTE